MPYQIILFDLDDTLVDFAASEIEGLKRIYEQFYQSLEWDHFVNSFRHINEALWKRVSAKEHALTPKEVCYLRFKQLNDTHPCSTTFETVAEEYSYHIGECVDWLPDVKRAVEFLHQKGHILGIVTNGTSDVQSKKRERLGLYDWFDCFVVSDEVGISKPNKEIFDIALEEIANKRNQPIHAYDKDAMLMVGDSIISDGHGAMNFGIHYCYVNSNPKPNPTEAQIAYHIDSVAQLPHCIGYDVEYEHFLKMANTSL